MSARTPVLERLFMQPDLRLLATLKLCDILVVDPDAAEDISISFRDDLMLSAAALALPYTDPDGDATGVNAWAVLHFLGDERVTRLYVCPRSKLAQRCRCKLSQLKTGKVD